MLELADKVIYVAILNVFEHGEYDYNEITNRESPWISGNFKKKSDGDSRTEK